MLWNVKVPLASVMAVAVGVCFFNDAMRAGRLPKDTWFAGMSTHVLDIWRLGSFTLSLMLSFRIRAAYDRCVRPQGVARVDGLSLTCNHSQYDGSYMATQ